MHTVVLDFETYYSTKDKYTLRHMSYPEYIYDPRFKVHGLVVDEDGQPPKWLWPEEIPEFLAGLPDDTVVVGHNLFFDLAILAWKYQWSPTYVVDTLLLANHVLGSAREGNGRNDLGSLATRLKLPTAKGDLSFADGVYVLDEPQRLMMEQYALKDADITRRVFDKLLPHVTNQQFELWLLDHTLRIYTDRPLPVDMALIAKAKTLVETRLKERRAAAGVAPIILSSNKQFADELKRRLAEHSIPVPMKRGKKGMIPALAKSDPGFDALLRSGVPAVVDLIRGRLVERSATQALARLNKLAKYNEWGGLRTHLVYYGAHTGRFAAGGGFNLQNLTSPDRAADPVDKEIAASIRAAILPGPGKKFVAVDAAQIEARVLAWLAGEYSILEKFATGADIYSEFISEVTGQTIRKPKETDDKDTAAKMKLWRHIGKEAVLGLGYSMGAEKFQARLRDPKTPQVAAMVEDGRMSLKEVQKIVAAYRDQFTNIVQFWSELNRAFMLAKSGAMRRVGPLTVKRAGPNAVAIVLPSGRHLYYRNIRRELGKDKEGKDKWEWKHGSGQRIYGGLLAENVTQAVARDILAESIFDSEAAGYEVVLHIHDEIVLRTDEADAQDAHDWLVENLGTPPAWAKGIVLAAEGRIADNLGK